MLSEQWWLMAFLQASLHSTWEMDRVWRCNGVEALKSG